MSAGGVRAGAMVGLGFCPTCGADYMKGEKHADDCEEDAFVYADPEYVKLSGRELDAYDDVAFIRKRGGRKGVLAQAQSKLERYERERKEREAYLRAEFRKRRTA